MSHGDLERWLHKEASATDKATFGQLRILLELAGTTSVAEMGRAHGGRETSASVNFRQKLARLEKALGVGALTRREGSYTRPTAAGIRVSDEFRILLQELRSIARTTDESPVWLIGAGDAWLQSLILPAAVKLSAAYPQWKWQVHNLRAHDISAGLRSGTLHFGFMRLQDAAKVDRLEPTGPSLRVPGYQVLVGNAIDAPRKPAELIRWALQQKRPLVQQNTTWWRLQASIDRELKLGAEFLRAEPSLRCETHPQAVNTVANSNAWCIAPVGLAKLPMPRVARATIALKVKEDEMGLFVYPRSLGKFANAEAARGTLRKQLGQELATFI